MRQSPFDIRTGKRLYGTPVTISAGEFVSDAPTGVPRFAASPEALETIRRIRENHGLDLEVRPYGNDMGGVYFYEGPGGHYDQEKRIVGLGLQNPSQFVLEHELGHATDPYLPKAHESEKEIERLFFEKMASGELDTPAKRFMYRQLGVPRRRLDSELTAQKHAADRMRERGLSDELTRGDLAAYPLAYIDQGIRRSDMNETTEGIVPDEVMGQFMENVYAPATGLYPQPSAPYLMPNANTAVEYGDVLRDRLFNLYQDKAYGDAVERERQRAADYAERRLQN
jgi:hypothetical protein